MVPLKTKMSAPSPAKISRKNWQYYHVQLKDSHHKGLNVYQYTQGKIEVKNIKPALQKPLPEDNPQQTTLHSADAISINDIDNIQQTISDIYSNCQPPEPTDDEGTGSTGPGI